MKKMIKVVQSKLLAGLLILLVYSCADKKWDEYYVKPEYLSEGSIMNALEGTPDYSEFTDLLRQTGYDSLLRANLLFTVFAPKNGSFSNINTSDAAELKKIIGMHIVSKAAILKDKMGKNYFLTVSGKPVRFNVTQDGGTVNKIVISSFDKKVLNGVFHEVTGVIMPFPNIYDFVLTDPDYSSFKRFIDSTYTQVVDVLKNKITGYDSLGKPIYKPPLIYLNNSDFMKVVQIDSEKMVSTVFMPSAAARNSIFSKMLATRDNNLNLIVPARAKYKNDTVINSYLIRANTVYRGDSALLLEYYYKYAAITKGEFAELADGINSFPNVYGGNFNVDKAQIVPDSTKYASNGYIYTLNDITLPDSAYRRSFMMQVRPMINPTLALPNGSVQNPDIIYRGAVNPLINSNSDTKDAAYYGGRYTTFTYRNPGGAIDFRMPYILKGKYRVTLKLRSNGGATIGAYYGSQKLVMFHASVSEVSAGPDDQILGTIDVLNSGPVVLTLVLEDNRGGSGFGLSAIVFDPVGN